MNSAGRTHSAAPRAITLASQFVASVDGERWSALDNMCAFLGGACGRVGDRCLWRGQEHRGRGHRRTAGEPWRALRVLDGGRRAGSPLERVRSYQRVTLSTCGRSAPPTWRSGRSGGARAGGPGSGANRGDAVLAVGVPMAVVRLEVDSAVVHRRLASDPTQERREDDLRVALKGSSEGRGVVWRTWSFRDSASPQISQAIGSWLGWLGTIPRQRTGHAAPRAGRAKKRVDAPGACSCRWGAGTELGLCGRGGPSATTSLREPSARGGRGRPGRASRAPAGRDQAGAGAGPMGRDS